MKQKRPGESYKSLVTVIKVKNGVPTAVRISGQVYTLRTPEQLGGVQK